MAQKVFVLESLPSDSDLSGATNLIENYWGDTEASIKFIAHRSYLDRLLASTGYLAIKVLKIKFSTKVDVRWLPFHISNAPLINMSWTSARYFVIKKEALEEIYDLGDNINSIGIEIASEDLPNGEKKYSILIGAGRFAYVLGGGSTLPGAGAKLP